MKPIAEAIERIMRKVEIMDGYERPMAPDEDVAERIDEMYDRYGYIPNPESIEAVRAHLSGYGILLSGPAGVGKTFLMKCLGIRIYTSARVAEYGIRGLSDLHEATQRGPICIDDLGIEPTVSEWGAKDDVLKTFIAYRAERQQARTYITTNLTSDEIVARYGDRTLSRLVGMCKLFRLTGTNRRAPEPEAAT